MKDLRIEALLNQYPHALWEYRPSIPVDQIDRKASHNLQVRVGHPVLTDKKEEYTIKVRNGVDFPALVCYLADDDSFVNLDGNQRTEAFIATKTKTTDAYVVLTDDPGTRIEIAYRCNELNGEPPSEQDRIVHARALVISGQKVADVAKKLNLSTSRVHDEMSDYYGQVRAKKCGVQADWNRIDVRKIRTRIHNGIKLDSAFILMVKYAANFKVGSNEISALVGRVGEYSSEEDQLTCVRGVISSAEKARKAAANNGAGNYLRDNPVNVMRIHLAYWPKGNHLDVVKAMNKDEREEMRPHLQNAASVLSKLLAELG